MAITMRIDGRSYPAAYEICDKCEGAGTGYLGNRGFVLTSEDFDEDPDLYNDVMDGHYDRPCIECDGTGKVLYPTTDSGRKALWNDTEIDAEWANEIRHEALRMGGLNALR